MMLLEMKQYCKKTLFLFLCRCNKRQWIFLFPNRILADEVKVRGHRCAGTQVCTGALLIRCARVPKQLSISWCRSNLLTCFQAKQFKSLISTTRKTNLMSLFHVESNYRATKMRLTLPRVPYFSVRQNTRLWVVSHVLGNSFP